MTLPLEQSMSGLMSDAQKVVDQVTRDDCGQMVGQIWMGGNGGLLSRETLKAVDKLRLTLMAIRSSQSPNGEARSSVGKGAGE